MDRQMNETAANILQAALKVFSKKGFNTATTREIAQEAGVAEGTIFRYFPTKKDILLSMAENFVARTAVETVQEKIIQGKNMSPEKTLGLLIRNRLDYLLDNYFLLRVLIIEAQYEELLRMRTDKILVPVSQIMADYINENIAKGVFRQIDARVTTELLVGIFAYYFGGKILFDPATGESDPAQLKKELYAQADAVIDIVLNGLKKEGF
jgi:AcrR family transcriptional regulator